MIKEGNCIINSDDFGIDLNTNKAIYESFIKGYISSASIIVNKHAFENTIELIHSNQLLKNSVGLHFNITQGFPLSDLIKKCKIFCNKDGMFIYKRAKPIFYLSKFEKDALYKEIKSQINELIRNGIFPTHIDSHHHVHTEFAISKVLVSAAKEENINAIRLSRNLGNNISFGKKIYKNLYKYELQHLNKMITTDYFGDYHDYNFTKGKPYTGKVIEIMVHARYNNLGQVVDLDSHLLNERIKTVINRFNFINYADLIKLKKY